MDADKIHVKDLVGRVLVAVHHIPSEWIEPNLVKYPESKGFYHCAGAFVEFADGLVVKLDMQMEVSRLSVADLPPGCEVLIPERISAEEQATRWKVVDVGCSPSYWSFCLLLACQKTVGYEVQEYMYGPTITQLDARKIEAWLHGPLPQLPPDYIEDWWEGPSGAYLTLEELEAPAPQPARFPPPVKEPFWKRLFS